MSSTKKSGIKIRRRKLVADFAGQLVSLKQLPSSLENGRVQLLWKKSESVKGLSAPQAVKNGCATIVGGDFSFDATLFCTSADASPPKTAFEAKPLEFQVVVEGTDRVLALARINLADYVHEQEYVTLRSELKRNDNPNAPPVQLKFTIRCRWTKLDGTPKSGSTSTPLSSQALHAQIREERADFITPTTGASRGAAIPSAAAAATAATSKDDARYSAEASLPPSALAPPASARFVAFKVLCKEVQGVPAGVDTVVLRWQNFPSEQRGEFAAVQVVGGVATLGGGACTAEFVAKLGSANGLMLSSSNRGSTLRFELYSMPGAKLLGFSEIECSILHSASLDSSSTVRSVRFSDKASLLFFTVSSAPTSGIGLHEQVLSPVRTDESYNFSPLTRDDVPMRKTLFSDDAATEGSGEGVVEEASEKPLQRSRSGKVVVDEAMGENPRSESPVQRVRSDSPVQRGPRGVDRVVLFSIRRFPRFVLDQKGQFGNRSFFFFGSRWILFHIESTMLFFNLLFLSVILMNSRSSPFLPLFLCPCIFSLLCCHASVVRNIMVFNFSLSTALHRQEILFTVARHTHTHTHASTHKHTLTHTHTHNTHTIWPRKRGPPFPDIGCI
jgi:hypothetical protein